MYEELVGRLMLENRCLMHHSLVTLRAVTNGLYKLDAVRPVPGHQSAEEQDLGHVLKQYAKSVSVKGSIYSNVDE